MSSLPGWFVGMNHCIGTFGKLHSEYEAEVGPIIYRLFYASRYLKGLDFQAYLCAMIAELELAIEQRTGQRPFFHELRRDAAYYFLQISEERERALVYDWLRKRWPIKQDSEVAYLELQPGRFGMIRREVSQAEAAEYARILAWQARM